MSLLFVANICNNTVEEGTLLMSLLIQSLLKTYFKFIDNTEVCWTLPSI